ncbi:TVP38/TMEM64 family protein [Limnoraphis robusta]|uniref:TVP38/TMEM64 family membrane protein n=1 Tax=Limnoraphis robusta CCNP1315 TaxID=3110306 RepID=A0ABU5TY47_9CYAN|nr:TVP38/TMEM64 family protein [Limnoraphis robusta]MEA5497843.1 TVP38/TMEM64 family protein [Limnoraphis robusta BA-68 BA1]MEA5519879.1 TVP38/TMEM64 family protein [Limnoraphis robusta CCNP1315]MEA5547914.1 TVP38/TMEM64 family protein [Limnoraphis robusta CCNP1324]
MFKFKKGIIFLTLICIFATAIAVYLLGGLDPEKIQIWLQKAGIWAPVIYIIVYTLATILILPSTALNLTGGAIFGPWLGTVWTSIAAIIAAIIAFTFTRTIGRNWVAKKLTGRWQAMDAEMQQGGLFYMFAIRLLPIIPYGLVNFSAGLTSVSYKDYIIGTMLGTIPGVLPFVMLGSTGLKALRTGDVLPLVGALSLTGMLVGGATWYRRRRSPPPQILQEIERSQSVHLSDED